MYKNITTKYKTKGGDKLTMGYLDDLDSGCLNK
jgi:hypothetical protein